MSDDDKLIKDHNYDGIQELDNPLPDWWLFTFLGTIIFAFFYFIHYEFSGGLTINDELKRDMAQVASLNKAGPDPAEEEKEITKLLGSADVAANGKSVYAGRCAACHGPELQGLIGPNLVDDFWIRGSGKVGEVALILRKGVIDKGMPAWESILKDEEIRSVTVYLVGQRGSNPPNPKPPQGEKVVR
jgi:cytochrome c oxidase cbb3-type subunit III